MAVPNPVLLIACTHEHEAELIAATLRLSGIEADTVGGLLAGFRAECPAVVEVFVDEGNLEPARAILHEYESRKVDWDKVDVGEPESPSTSD